MSTPKHTPGPWEIDGSDIRQQGGYNIATMRCFGTHALSVAKEANARLIAAAPDLLAMLIACEDQLRGVTGALPGSDSAEVCAAARAAIERATSK
jgi:hypothetical protein